MPPSSNKNKSKGATVPKPRKAAAPKSKETTAAQKAATARSAPPPPAESPRLASISRTPLRPRRLPPNQSSTEPLASSGLDVTATPTALSRASAQSSRPRPLARRQLGTQTDCSVIRSGTPSAVPSPSHVMPQDSNPVRSVTELREFTIQEIIDGRDSLRLASTRDVHLDAPVTTSVPPALTMEQELVLLRARVSQYESQGPPPSASAQPIVSLRPRFTPLQKPKESKKSAYRLASMAKVLGLDHLGTKEKALQNMSKYAIHVIQFLTKIRKSPVLHEVFFVKDCEGRRRFDKHWPILEMLRVVLMNQRSTRNKARKQKELAQRLYNISLAKGTLVWPGKNTLQELKPPKEPGKPGRKKKAPVPPTTANCEREGCPMSGVERQGNVQPEVEIPVPPTPAAGDEAAMTTEQTAALSVLELQQQNDVEEQEIDMSEMEGGENTDEEDENDEDGMGSDDPANAYLSSSEEELFGDSEDGEEDEPEVELDEEDLPLGGS
ncbi:hypothetical protein QFC21_005594 [Naganishia friedmannii]|uniref:Uncharacterized protein n=1 Tax=Naganishia friedmannii TaxID=89922 RepID=A0ACC2V796_9TREE|nr:hypothetical protein QFC21_005594 [Naganishia friedmannii]